MQRHFGPDNMMPAQDTPSNTIQGVNNASHHHNGVYATNGVPTTQQQQSPATSMMASANNVKAIFQPPVLKPPLQPPVFRPTLQPSTNGTSGAPKLPASFPPAGLAGIPSLVRPIGLPASLSSVAPPLFNARMPASTIGNNNNSNPSFSSANPTNVINLTNSSSSVSNSFNSHSLPFSTSSSNSSVPSSAISSVHTTGVFKPLAIAPPVNGPTWNNATTLKPAMSLNSSTGSFNNLSISVPPIRPVQVQATPTSAPHPSLQPSFQSRPAFSQVPPSSLNSSFPPPPLRQSFAPRPAGVPFVAPPPLGPQLSGTAPLRPPPLGPTSSVPPTIRHPPLAPPSLGPPLVPPPLTAAPIAPPPLGPPPLSRPLAPPPSQQQQVPGYPTALAPPPLTRPPPPTIHQQRYPQQPDHYQQQQQQPHQFQQQFQHQQYGAYTKPSSHKSSVLRDGWNKGWGTESVDLLQYRQVLPSEGVEPPRPVLAQDFLKNCTPDLLRCTFTKIPETKNLLQKVKMPFGILLHPFKDLEQLPVVNCSQIVRCRSCRTYINPFVVFRGEKRWECNLCYRLNDLPDEFQFDPHSQTYGDPSRRPEVREATIEYIAPSEYMLRPPQPAVYLWLLDTSRQAVDTGYLDIVCHVLLKHLDNIPGDKRRLIGFMTFSATVQFYLMPEGSNSVNQLEVGDLDDMFVPYPDDLLVNVVEQREQIEEFLTTLPQTHANTTHTQSALGPALTAAYKLLSPLGGRLTVLTSLLPNLGPGSLKPREDPNQRAATDVLHLNPATDFYKKLALDCSGQQIAVDLFTLNSQYIDLATLSGVSKFSGGSVYHFPNFHTHLNPPSVDAFASCLTRYITRKIGFEAVMRIRATRGLAITNFHGHFFVRSPDLLSLPNINPDAGFAMQVAIEEPLHNIRSATFQAALLYTSSRGERRIRVHTLNIPVTGNLHDVVNSADQQACIALLARMAVDRCQQSTSTDARDALVNACIDALTSYRNSLTQSPGRALMASRNLQLWPLYTLALLKSISFRGGLSTKLDDRVYAMCEIKTQPTNALIKSIYPDLYPVHDLTDKGAIEVDDEVVPQPPRLQLSSEYIKQDGAYLADTGSKLYLYVRSCVSPEWLQDVLGVASYSALPQIMHQLPDTSDNQAANLLTAFIKHLNSDRPYPSPLVIIREDSPARQQFMLLLVENRSEGMSTMSYVEFVQSIASGVK